MYSGSWGYTERRGGMTISRMLPQRQASMIFYLSLTWKEDIEGLQEDKNTRKRRISWKEKYREQEICENMENEHWIWMTYGESEIWRVGKRKYVMKSCHEKKYHDKTDRRTTWTHPEECLMKWNSGWGTKPWGGNNKGEDKMKRPNIYISSSINSNKYKTTREDDDLFTMTSTL